MTAVTVLILSIFKAFINLIKNIVDRYVVRQIISKGKELPMWKWFTLSFIKSLTLQQLFALGVIAAFTLVTFPLGIWIGSFSMKMSLPMGYMVSGVVNALLVPINIFIVDRTLKEMDITPTTIAAIALIEISLLLWVVGWYIIYTQQQTV